MRHLILLTMLSGLCGLTHEVLLSRVLGNFLGETVFVNITILIFFFSGLAFGTFFNRLFVNKLWLIECGLGFLGITFSLLMLPVPLISTSSTFLDCLLIASFTLPIGFLAGTTIPLFSTYLSESENSGQSFNKVYFFYHLAAALFVLFLDQLLIKKIGIQGSYLIVSGLNILTGLSLKLSKNERIFPKTVPLKDSLILEIAFLSILSGVVQFGLLKLVTTMLGPHRSHFALYIFCSLLSLPMATFTVEKLNLNYYSLKKRLSWALGLSLLFPYGVGLITRMAHTLDFPDVLIRLFLIGILTLPTLFTFALIVPSLAKTEELKGQDFGKWLGLVSAGNAIGMLLHILLIYQFVFFEWIIISACVLTFVLLKNYKKKAIILILIHFSLIFFTNQSTKFRFSFRFFQEDYFYNQMYKAKVETYRKGPHEISLFEDNISTTLVVDGYKTIRFVGKRNPSELLLGYSQGLYSQHHKNAAVIGVGSGITVNVLDLFYDHVDAIELNSAVAFAQEIFRKKGFGLNSEIPLIVDDGFRFLKRTNKKYDAIVNNSTSPQYSVASKIWTREFWEIVKKSLNHGGVATTFLDGSMNREVIQTILKTMQSVFPHCHLFLLREKYGNLICSESPLAPKMHPNLALNKMAESLEVETNELMDLTRSLSFPINNWKERKFEGSIHTINKPILDYEISLRLSRVWAKNPAWYLFDNIDLNINDFAFPKENQDRLKKRCLFLSKWSDAKRIGCK